MTDPLDMLDEEFSAAQTHLELTMKLVEQHKLIQQMQGLMTQADARMRSLKGENARLVTLNHAYLDSLRWIEECWPFKLLDRVLKFRVREQLRG